MYRFTPNRLQRNWFIRNLDCNFVMHGYYLHTYMRFPKRSLVYEYLYINTNIHIYFNYVHNAYMLIRLCFILFRNPEILWIKWHLDSNILFLLGSKILKDVVWCDAIMKHEKRWYSISLDMVPRLWTEGRKPLFGIGRHNYPISMQLTRMFITPARVKGLHRNSRFALCIEHLTRLPKLFV